MTTATVSRVYNFSAGPATLPLSVLQQIQNEMICLPGVGASVMEISHRSQDFDLIIDNARNRVAQLVNLPDTHEILFLQGGAALQNVMMPCNFLTDASQIADYIVTGSWGKKSAAEVSRFGKLNVAWDGSDSGFCQTPQTDALSLTPGAAYCHITSNETIQGVQFPELPDVGDTPLLADKSSDMFSEPVDVSKYGLIYACAQKNCGIAGVTLVILEKSLLERCDDRIPSYLDYSKHSKSGSRFNTPPTFAIYVTGLVCKWLQEEMGGLDQVKTINESKAKMLYDIVDASDGFYTGHAAPSSRSTMNVVFKLGSDDLDSRFLSEAAEQGMTTLKGHRSLGGIRASIYNAMPVEGVEALSQFMNDFAQRNG
ncbi:MAG: 3-phosphoserine/phosphohydroxythreonine transaminase [Planctomycetota bacterium]